MNPNTTPKCSICEQWLDEKHDWNGRIWWEHPKPCTAVARVFALDDELGYLKQCIECDKKFSVASSRANRTVCDGCRKPRGRRLTLARYRAGAELAKQEHVRVVETLRQCSA